MEVNAASLRQKSGSISDLDVPNQVVMERAQSEVSSTSMNWRNKALSCEAVRAFEAKRKAEVDIHHEKDKLYWNHFESVIRTSQQQITALEAFFNAKLQADATYAEALIKASALLDSPNDALKTTLLSTEHGIDALGEVHQVTSEKLQHFVSAVKRDIIVKLVEEMGKVVNTSASKMIVEGNKLNQRLYATQARVLEFFGAYDALFRQMEGQRGEKTAADLWLAEMEYYISVQALRDVRQQYVTGMANLFQQFKALEVNRNATIKSVLEAYVRKQKLLYSELSGILAEVLTTVQRITPERDVSVVLKQIPLNHTALSVSSQATEAQLFNSLRKPLASPLVSRSGIVERQNTNSIFRSWKKTLCVVTQDRFLHVIDIPEDSHGTIDDLLVLYGNTGPEEVGGKAGLKVSIQLENSKVAVVSEGKPAFEIVETMPVRGMMGMFKNETMRKYTFRFPNSNELMDWVLAIR